MRYKPTDRLFGLSQLGQTSYGTDRNITNTSSGNSGTARAGLIANGMNKAVAAAKAMMSGEEANWDRYKDVMTHNANISKYIADNIMKAQLAEQENSKLMVDAAIKSAAMREDIDTRAAAGKAANLTNLFDSLGDIGREAYIRQMMETNPALYYGIDRWGNVSYKNAANGGYLTIKRKRRRR